MSRTKSTEPLHPAIAALVDEMAAHLVRKHLAGKLPPLERKSSVPKAPTLPAKRRAA